MIHLVLRSTLLRIGILSYSKRIIHLIVGFYAKKNEQSVVPNVTS